MSYVMLKIYNARASCNAAYNVVPGLHATLLAISATLLAMLCQGFMQHCLQCHARVSCNTAYNVVPGLRATLPTMSCQGFMQHCLCLQCRARASCNTACNVCNTAQCRARVSCNTACNVCNAAYNVVPGLHATLLAISATLLAMLCQGFMQHCLQCCARVSCNAAYNVCNTAYNIVPGLHATLLAMLCQGFMQRCLQRHANFKHCLHKGARCEERQQIHTQQDQRIHEV